MCTCGREEGSFFAAPKCQTVSQATCLAPFHLGAPIGQVVGARVFRIRSAAASSQRANTRVHSALCETRWEGDRSLFTGVVHGDGQSFEGYDADLCVAGWRLVANACAVSVSGTLLFLIQDVDGAKLSASSSRTAACAARLGQQLC